MVAREILVLQVGVQLPEARFRNEVHMGMFDTVLLECPKCQCKMSFQTKLGLCRMRTYHQMSVAADVAEAIVGDTVTCPGCNQVLQLLSAFAVPTIPFNLVPVYDRGQFHHDAEVVKDLRHLENWPPAKD